MKDYRKKLDRLLGKSPAPLSIWHKLYEDAPVNMPMAPMAPTKPSTKPPITKPSTPSRPSPLSPKINPGTSPKPRAKSTGINEAYDDFVSQRTRDLYTKGDPRFGFSSHPMMKKHGEGIAREAYGHSNDLDNDSLSDTSPERIILE